AQARSAILEAPVGEHRRPESRVPQTTIGIDRRAADGGQGAQMLDDAADRIEADLARQLDILGIRHEGVLAATAIHVVVLEARQVLRIIAERLELVLAALP